MYWNRNRAIEREKAGFKRSVPAIESSSVPVHRACSPCTSLPSVSSLARLSRSLRSYSAARYWICASAERTRRYRLSISLHLAHVHSICRNITDCPLIPVRWTTAAEPLSSELLFLLVIIHLRLILFKYSIRNQAEINRIFGSPSSSSSSSAFPFPASHRLIDRPA